MVDTIYPVDAVTGAPAYSGRMLRQVGAITFGGATAARPLGGRSGVRPGTSVTTVTATSTTWTCGPLSGVADVETAAEAGLVTFALDAVATGAITAASASFARQDLIYIQIDIPVEDGSAVPTVTRKYIAGTIASTDPALPVSHAFAIARINVPISGGGSPTVTWIAPYAVAAGGILPVPSSASYPANPHIGQLVDDAALGGPVRWSGSVWVRLQPTRGTTTVMTDASGLANIAHGLGAVPSIAMLSPVFTTDTVSSVFAPTRGALTSTNIQLVAFRNDSHARLTGTSVTVDWVAYP